MDGDPIAHRLPLLVGTEDSDRLFLRLVLQKLANGRSGPLFHLDHDMMPVGPLKARLFTSDLREQVSVGGR